MKRAELPQRLGLPMAEIRNRVLQHGIRWPGPEEDISPAEFDAIKAAAEEPPHPPDVPSTPTPPPSADVHTVPHAPKEAASFDIRWEYYAKKWRGRQRGIGIIGLAGAGKTSYLFVLGHKHYLFHLNNWQITARTDAYNSFLTQTEPKLEDGWPKTNPNEPPRVFNMFTLLHERPSLVSAVRAAQATTSTGRHPLLRYLGPLGRYVQKRALLRDIPVCSFDVAGELIRAVFTGAYDRTITRYSYSDIDALCEAICAVEGFLVILDSELAADPASVEKLQEEQAQWDFIFERLCRIDSGAYGRFIERPVAIVLNKADYFVLNPAACHNGDLLGMKDLLSLRREAVPEAYEQTRRRTFHERVDKVRAFVRQRYPTIYSYVERVNGEKKLKHVGFFAMSCWGKHPDPPDRPGRDIYPTLVEEPLEWLAHAILQRRIRQQLRTLVRRTAAVAAAAVLLLVSGNVLFLWTSSLAYNYALRAQQSAALSLTVANPIRHIARLAGNRKYDERIASIWLILFKSGVLTESEYRSSIASLDLPPERVTEMSSDPSVQEHCAILTIKQISDDATLAQCQDTLRRALKSAPHAEQTLKETAAGVFIGIANKRLASGRYKEAWEFITEAHNAAPDSDALLDGAFLKHTKHIATAALENGNPRFAIDVLTHLSSARQLDADAAALLAHAQRAAHMAFIPGDRTSQPFYLDKYEVSTREYEQFRLNHSALFSRYREFSPDPDYPVIFVSYDDARDYAASIRKRLPTNEEWERAAGELLRRIDRLRINDDDARMRRTVRVNGIDFPDDITSHGVRHILGNVAEWVTSASGPLARGTSWLDSKTYTTRRLMPDYRDREVGFRCAMDCLP